LPTIQLHYDGWLALPAEARKHLEVATGDRLEIELTENGLVLRPAKQAKEVAAPEPEAAVAAQPATAPAQPSAPVKAEKEAVKSRRLPKTIAQDPAARVKVGGRRKSTPTVPT
jgi:AbrB family looped-hinge helix DNA binding protein